MKSKILTTEEIATIIKIVEKILSTIEGKVAFASGPIRVCFGKPNNGGNNRDEYIYRVSITSSNGGAELRWVFYDSAASIAEWAWHVAADAFHRLDDNIHGPIAEKLWPSDNGYKPDYERLMTEE